MDGEPRTATSTFTQLLSSDQVQCCFTSTETVRTIRDGEPRTFTSTFAQFLSSAKRARLKESSIGMKQLAKRATSGDLAVPASVSPVAEIRINGQETAYSVSLCPEARAARAERLQERRVVVVVGGGGLEEEEEEEMECCSPTSQSVNPTLAALPGKWDPPALSCCPAPRSHNHHCHSGGLE